MDACNCYRSKTTNWKKDSWRIKKSSRFGKYALAIGIAAGFVFLAALFTVLDSSSGISDTMICVAIAASSMSVFLSSMETQKKKSCKTSTPKV